MSTKTAAREPLLDAQDDLQFFVLVNGRRVHILAEFRPLQMPDGAPTGPGVDFMASLLGSLVALCGAHVRRNEHQAGLVSGFNDRDLCISCYRRLPEHLQPKAFEHD